MCICYEKYRGLRCGNIGCAFVTKSIRVCGAGFWGVKPQLHLDENVAVADVVLHAVNGREAKSYDT
jgi:hypothetical protein